MPISSLIVSAEEGATTRVVTALQALPEITLAQVEGERIAVLTETTSREADKALWDQLEQQDGVRAVELIYHNFEDLEGVTS